ncbi:MAG: 2-oxo acid dehydrogenase subunit E2 [Proteobacteria bacterium]|nr:2-oxo acid dehydrogenase subunit E2 [Pseudomonadota bacterium]
MTFTTRKLTSMRMMIYDMLKRTREYHAPTLATFEWDVTDTLARIEELRAKDVRVSMASLLIKATGEVIAKNERLRTRVYHTALGPREVTYDETSCNLIVSREGPDGYVLFASVIRDVPSLSVLDIADEVRRIKSTPFEELEEGKALMRLKHLPRALTKLHDYKVRSDPAYFIKHFGSYGLSATMHRDSGLTGGAVPGPGTLFFPSRIGDQPVVVNGEIVIRTMLVLGLSVDHQITDGLEHIAAAMHLKKLVENPDILLGDL